MKIEVPDRLTLPSGPFESPRPGDHGTGLGRAREGPRSYHGRKFDSSLRQKGPFVGKTRPAADPLDRVVRPRTGRRRQNGTKSSFLESSRRAQQVAPNRRIQIDGARAVRAREKKRHEEASPGGLAKKETRGGAAAASRRPMQLVPGALAQEEDTQHTAAASMMRRRLGRHPARCGGVSKIDGAPAGGGREEEDTPHTAAAGARGGRAGRRSRRGEGPSSVVRGPRRPRRPPPGRGCARSSNQAPPADSGGRGPDGSEPGGTTRTAKRARRASGPVPRRDREGRRRRGGLGRDDAPPRRVSFFARPPGPKLRRSSDTAIDEAVCVLLQGVRRRGRCGPRQSEPEGRAAPSAGGKDARRFILNAPIESRFVERDEGITGGYFSYNSEDGPRQEMRSSDRQSDSEGRAAQSVLLRARRGVAGSRPGGGRLRERRVSKCQRARWPRRFHRFLRKAGRVGPPAESRGVELSPRPAVDGSSGLFTAVLRRESPPKPQRPNLELSARIRRTANGAAPAPAARPAGRPGGTTP
ncbi:hypothetical protein THAOC_35418, partial [Thalassiosira oceanica]